MRSTPHPGSVIAARTARRLLLVLALAACGESNRGGDPSNTPPGQSDTRVASKGQRPPNCAPSPGINPALLNDTVPWDSLTKWRAAAGVLFRDENPDSTADSVALCDSCARVRLKNVSEQRTFCNTQQNMLDSTRIVGVWAVDSGTVTPPNWGHTFNPGDSIFVFARDTLARLAYKVDNKVHMAPDSAFRFFYCNDGHRGRRPEARWRHTRPRPETMPRDTLGEPDPPGTYGWMACASGCCQFYIPPHPNAGNNGARPPCPGRP